MYRAEGDPNKRARLHQLGSADDAHSFFENADLRQVMQEAGVDVGSLRLEFFEEA